jgi:hypothetical protein
MPELSPIKYMYLLNKSLQFMSIMWQELYYRLSDHFVNTCRPGGVCQTNLERIDYQVLFFKDRNF